MSTGRLDTYIPDYANRVALPSGVFWTGAYVPLYGAEGVAIQVATSGGCAGTLYVWPTNFAKRGAETNQAGFPMGATAAPLTVDVPANSTSASVMLNSTTAALYFESFYCVFASSAAGNLTIAINVRRKNA